jgi:arabinogalactan oligomer/maltooligosaccharide transport system permease protein
LLITASLVSGDARAEEPVVIWHSYRGAEQSALTEVIESYQRQHPGRRVRALALPYDAFASKITATVPRGHGPDLFVFAHERIGSWAERGIVRPVDLGDKQQFLPRTLEALQYQGKHYGLPLSYKCVALFYNRALVPKPPSSTEELIALAKARTDPQAGRFGLAYATDEFYFHAPWLFGFGGQLFDKAGQPRLDSAAIVRSVTFVQRLVLEEGIVPREANTALATRLFNGGQAAMVINGPWFIGEIAKDIDVGIAPLPVVSETGLPATPFLTVEAVMLSGSARQPERALHFARFLAGQGGALTRALTGRQAVAFTPAYTDPRVAQDQVLAAFRRQLDRSVPMDNRPQMQLIWEPAKAALMSALRGVDPKEALQRAQARIRAIARPAPPAQSPVPYIVVLGLVALILVGFWYLRSRGRRGSLLAEMRQGKRAYAYLAPALTGLLLLALLPFTVALGISFCRHDAGDFAFVGLANFVDILSSESFGLTDPLSFYFTLLVTMLWTVANVTLHLVIGMALALVLKEPWLRLRGVYRALLIIPWAIPNYITALIWKGMFHQQYGAINGLLGSLGLEPVSWFSGFWTAFCANLVTNTWLGFPFMMVVVLGALQAIPADLYEAAQVDGASSWQRFRHVTLPLLRPALVPAVLLGMVWTFNMFNIVYLVSGGEPDGATDILISEAFRWAFQRQEQYGYAAAYATLIFCILVAYTLATRRLVAKEDTA